LLSILRNYKGVYQNALTLSKLEKSWNQTKREKEVILFLPKSYL